MMSGSPLPAAPSAISSQRRLRRGFTLIELLVVITVIAILAAIAVPVAGNAMESAKKAKASVVCSSVATAIGEFEREFNNVPSSWTENMQSANATLFDHLTGKDDSINRSKINYALDMKQTKKQIDGLNMNDNTLYDPWGRVYQFAVDADGDGQVEDPINSGEMINQTGIVWSAGRDGDFGGGGGSSKKNQDNPRSW